MKLDHLSSLILGPTTTRLRFALRKLRPTTATRNAARVQEKGVAGAIEPPFVHTRHTL